MKRKTLKITLLSLVFLLLIFCAWYYLVWNFANNFPKEVENQKQKTDAIIVLTGGAGRINEGISLLNNGIGKKLFISGVGPAVQSQELILPTWADQDNLISNTFLGRSAKNTHGNALEVNKWTIENDIKSIRLVTAYYHMPRSVLEIKNTNPKLEIIMHPVFPKQLRSRWFLQPRTAILITEEYCKYIFSTIRYWSKRKFLS